MYKEGLRNVPTKRMWSFYLNYILEISEDLSTLPTFKKNFLKNAFEAAHKESMLSEQHYLFWVCCFIASNNFYFILFVKLICFYKRSEV